jgi:hypothetical protein
MKALAENGDPAGLPMLTQTSRAIALDASGLSRAPEAAPRDGERVPGR